MLNPTAIEDNKFSVLNALSTVDREGIPELLYFLENSDFFIAPASAKYHRSYVGGLCEHSLKVTKLFMERNRLLEDSIPDESIAIIGILHDICKIGLYGFGENGYKTVKTHPACSRHATLSIEIIQKYIELTEAERDCILYHMGLFGCYSDYHGPEYTAEELHKAISKCPAVQIFAAADNEEAHWKKEL